jgi:pimeloyl-ACP methyl ester carboxylesterase
MSFLSHLTAACALPAAIVCLVAGSTLAADLTPLPKVQTKGTGPVQVILIPGLTCDGTVWDAFMARNEAKYTMHAVTLPGFGGTEAPPAPADNTGTPWLDNAQAAVLKLIEEKQLDKPVVMGHSLGGHVAYRLAGAAPDKIGGAVSVEGAPAFPLGPAPLPKEQRVQMVEQQVAPMLLNVTEEDWAKQQDQMAQGMINDAARGAQLREMFRTTKREVGARYMLELIKSDVSEEAVKSSAPVLTILAVNNDNAAMGIDSEGMKKMWRGLMPGRLSESIEFVEGSRHFVMDDKPAELDAIFEEFVNVKIKGMAPANEPLPVKQEGQPPSGSGEAPAAEPAPKPE